jgi:hypothetical protein
MSNFDNVQINIRERPLSTDINEAQSMIQRTVADSLMRILSSRSNTASVPRNCALGGLEVAPSGTNVLVQPGMLVQFSTTLTPTPDPLDSDYRLGRNPEPEVVVMPSPGTTTWYVVEAQVTPVVTVSEVRDVLDPGSGAFIPTLVTKQTEYRLAFQLVAGVAGGSIPVPTGGNWVPLAAVRRVGGGPAVTAADIIPLAAQWGDGGGGVYSETDAGDHAVQCLAATFVQVTFQRPARNNGAPMYFRDAPASIDPGTATYLSPSTTLAANTWYYLYLCPWGSLLPTRFYGADITHNGLLVLSDVPPDVSADGLRRPSAPIDLPAPWDLGSAPAVSSCLCIGALLRNSGNTGFVTQVLRAPGQYAITAVQVFNGAPSFIGVGQMATQVTLPTPLGALGSEVECLLTTSAAGLFAMDLGLSNTFNAAPREQVGDMYIGGSGGTASYGKTWVSVGTPGTVVYIRGATAIANANVTGLTVRLIGYSW